MSRHIQVFKASYGTTYINLRGGRGRRSVLTTIAIQDEEDVLQLAYALMAAARSQGPHSTTIYKGERTPDL